MSMQSGSHAVVIGGSMAGLLAGRVLADHFDRVTIVERDRFPATPAFRKGVPQSRHVHILLVRGRMILEQLFPQLHDNLLAAGAPLLNLTNDLKFFNAVGWVPRFPSAITTFSCSRELLEWSVRRQVAANSKVGLIEECDVIDLLPSAAKAGAAGVRIRRRAGQDGSAGDDLHADLVVDASGRSSRAVEWLRALGYAPPQETTINSFLGYASRVYQRPAGMDADWKGMLIGARPLTNPRGGGLLPLEGDRWHVTVAGVGRDHPPTEEAGFLEFVQSLPSPLIYEAIKDAQPLSAIYGYQRTENRLRHYERMPRWPDGFVTLGDAVCAFNPVYGQGMTTAALGAMTLDRVLRDRQATAASSGFAQRFQRELAKSNQAAWLMATGEDFRYPTTEGGRPNYVTRLMHRYMDRMIALSSENSALWATFLEAAHLLKPPTSLFRPAIASQVLLRRPKQA